MKRRSTTIFDLDYCSFQRILSYLRHVDKLSVLLATKCIAISSEANIDSEPFDLSNIQANFSVEEIEQLLTNYGGYVKRLRHTKWLSDETTLSYIKLLPENCTNLQEVYFFELEITMTNIYGQILNSARNTIEKLTLENCTLKMPAFQLIANLSALKVLNLHRSKRSGQEFGRLENRNDLNLDVVLKIQRNLKELTICDSFFSKQYLEICAMKSFREISLPGCFEEFILEYLKDLAGNVIPVESLEIKMPVCFPKMRDTMKSEIVERIIILDKLRVLSFRNSAFLEDSHLVKISKFCRKIELLDLYRTSFSDLGIIGCLKYLKRLRHLDVSYCDVKKSCYSRLVEIRQKVGFTQKLIVYIRPQMELKAILQSDEYADTMAIVQLTLTWMRSAKDSSILERLEQLNRKPSLLVLDDNSLHHIMQFLPLVDQLNLSLTNSRFENIIKHFLRVHPFKTAEFMANWDISEARILLSHFGKMVKKIHIMRSEVAFTSVYYASLPKYFRNVVELHSNDFKLCKEVISNSRNSLEAIYVNSCEIDNAVTFEISKAARLQTLKLKRCTLIGVNLGNLTNLSSLNLFYVKNLEPTSFIAICKSNRLNDLNIFGCDKLNNESFQALVKTQTSLEFLGIGGNYAATNLHVVAGLASLKYLVMWIFSWDRELALMDALAELKYDQLRYLYIAMAPTDPRNTAEHSTIIEKISKLRNLVYLGMAHRNEINVNFISTIANACPLLKALNVNGAKNLSNGAVLEAIRLFKHLRYFDIHDCGISSLNLIYHEALKITMKESGRRPLVLHGDISHELITYLMKTRDYINNTKYLKLSSEYLYKLDKYKLVEELTS